MTKKRLRLFVSYAGTAQAARDVVSRLRSQEVLEVWDFRSRPLKLGEVIDPTTAAEVQQSQALVLLLSPDALASSHVAAELTAARNADIRVFCLVTAEALQSRPWPVPFDALTSKWVVVDFARLESIENAIRHICMALEVPHLPPLAEDQEFPIAQRIYQELLGLLPGDLDYGNSTYHSLLQMAASVHGAYRRREFATASITLGALAAMMQSEFPGAEPYYPLLARALCEMDQDHLNEAAELVERCRQTVARAPRLERDPILPWIAAILDFHLRRYERALAGFSRVEVLHGKLDVWGHCYVVLCRVLNKQQVNIEQEFRRIHELDDGKHERRIEFARARAHLAHWNFAVASEIFEAQAPRDDEPAELADYGAALIGAGRASDAQDLLSGVVDRGGSDVRLARALTRAKIRCGGRAATETACREFVDKHPEDRLGLAELLGECSNLSYSGRAPLILAQALLGTFRDRPPASRLDFQLAADANEALGNRERAAYDRERAGLPTP
jgi:hypothetical protein